MTEFAGLHEKLAEVIGLTQAAQRISRRVMALAEEELEPDLLRLVEQLNRQMFELHRRCQAVADTRAGVKPSWVTAKARETKQAVGGLMRERERIDDAKALDALGLLAMAIANALLHWRALPALMGPDKDPPIAELVSFAVAIQEHQVEVITAFRCRAAGSALPCSAAGVPVRADW